MAKRSFNCVDNGGKHQAFTVTASNKQDAIKKALERASKKAAGAKIFVQFDQQLFGALLYIRASRKSS